MRLQGNKSPKKARRRRQENALTQESHISKKRRRFKIKPDKEANHCWGL